MTMYSFQGRDHDGKLISGRRQASSEDVLGGQLFKEGITPIKIDLAERKIDQLENWWYEKTGKGIKNSEMIMFARQMYSLSKAGIPLISALVRLAETTNNPFFSNALWGVVQNIEAGQDLATAMSKFPKIFPGMMISLVRVGESSGKLDEIFLQITTYLELSEDTRKRFVSTMRYPVMVFVSLIAAIIVINIFVIPAFAKLFANVKLQLPLPTRILLAFSNFMVNYWIILVLGVVSVVTGIWFYLKTPEGKYAWGKYQLKIPIVGEILQRILLARLCRSLGLMLRAGLSIIQSLELVGNTLDNMYAAARVKELHDAIERGESLTSAATSVGLFSPLMTQMLAVGEETGSIDNMLIEIADFYDREVDYSLRKLGDAIEPVMLIGLAIIVLVLALAVYLPIWDLTKIAKQGTG